MARPITYTDEILVQAAEGSTTLRKGSVRQRMLDFVRAQPGGATIGEINKRFPYLRPQTRPTVAALLRNGWLTSDVSLPKSTVSQGAAQ